MSLLIGIYITKSKKPVNLSINGFSKHGGEGGIRTLEGLRLTHFPGVLLRPLGHLTNFKLGIFFKGVTEIPLMAEARFDKPQNHDILKAPHCTQ